MDLESRRHSRHSAAGLGTGGFLFLREAFVLLTFYPKNRGDSYPVFEKIFQKEKQSKRTAFALKALSAVRRARGFLLYKVREVHLPGFTGAFAGFLRMGTYRFARHEDKVDSNFIEYKRKNYKNQLIFRL